MQRGSSVWVRDGERGVPALIERTNLDFSASLFHEEPHTLVGLGLYSVSWLTCQSLPDTFPQTHRNNVLLAIWALSPVKLAPMISHHKENWLNLDGCWLLMTRWLSGSLSKADRADSSIFQNGCSTTSVHPQDVYVQRHQLLSVWLMTLLVDCHLQFKLHCITTPHAFMKMGL
jgi:hypothetical protein